MILNCLGISVLALCVTAVIRNLMPAIAPLISTAAGIAIVLVCLVNCNESIKYYYDICVNSGYGEYFKIMLKGVGVALITNIGTELCKDCGENQLSSKLEFAAKIELLAIALPLVEKLLGVSRSIMFE